MHATCTDTYTGTVFSFNDCINENNPKSYLKNGSYYSYKCSVESDETVLWMKSPRGN